MGRCNGIIPTEKSSNAFPCNDNACGSARAGWIHCGSVCCWVKTLYFVFFFFHFVWSFADSFWQKIPCKMCVVKIQYFLVFRWFDETYSTRTPIIFRQPPLSTIANIFILPLVTSGHCILLLMLFKRVEIAVTTPSRCDKIFPEGWKKMIFACNLFVGFFLLQNADVWICCSLITIVITIIMFSQFMHPTIRGKMTSFDVVSFVIGAVCQQGTHLVIRTLSGRFIIITTFLAMLAIFTSYSASIVALLQSPSHLITTIDDLLNSPIKLALQDAGYNRYSYLKDNDSLLTKIYDKKIRPFGDAGWVNKHMSCTIYFYAIIKWGEWGSGCKRGRTQI